MSHPVKVPKKLIEVALPLDAINAESTRRKQKAPKGWPTSFHKWWAQRPIAAARAVLFAQLVNDPGFQQGDGFRYGQNRKDAAAERKRLFDIIAELIQWDNSANPTVLERATTEIRKSWREVCELNKDHPLAASHFDPERLPTLCDPFAGGGTIPLECQRLGLRTRASDLNPVAVLINKALMEFPRRFVDRPPVRPTPQQTATREMPFTRKWPGSTGLAEDVRYYGAWMREEAHKRIGHLYPRIKVTPAMARGRADLTSMVGAELTPVAWIWARTVESPSPAFRHTPVPLVSNFVLSTKGEGVYVEPVIKGSRYSFDIKVGKPPAKAARGTKEGKATFRCLLSEAPIDSNYIKTEAKAGRMGARMMAVVAEGERRRVYLPPTPAMEEVALNANPEWKPEGKIVEDARAFTPTLYGLATWSDLFSARQLAGLTVFSDLVGGALERCQQDALKAGISNDVRGLNSGGSGAKAYAEAVATYLAMVVDRMVFYGSTLCGWLTKDNAMSKSMPQQALMMSWDFAEGNPFGKSSADVDTCIRSAANYLEIAAPRGDVVVEQQDACSLSGDELGLIVSTDPPYYDNVPYADLSDFFYVWLRRSLKPVFPELLATIATPKSEELVACAYRRDGKIGAGRFFLDGMTKAMRRIEELSHPAFPVTIYYAFKQSENDAEGETASTGWETFLEAVLRAGFVITGTWPMRTEGEQRMRASESNALASSIVIVCRKRRVDATAISRRDFLRELNVVLPEALDEMTNGSGEGSMPVAPVDLSQAIIGPGMGVFSQYSAVLEADGSPMSAKTALQLINRFLAEDDFDADTQFCLRWFEQFSWNEGAFGEADKLARAKATSVEGLDEAGVLFSGKGKVRLRKWSDYPDDWDPRTDKRLPVWEALHQLIRIFKQDGESGAGKVLAVVQSKSEAVRQLAYRLYTLCERKGFAEDARAYNELVSSWSAIESASVQEPKRNEQLKLFGGKA
jgi:putative DNA methylase